MIKNFISVRRTAAAALLAGVATLVAVGPANAIHTRGTHGKRNSAASSRIQPALGYAWLKYIGVVASTGDNGAVFLTVNSGGLADMAGLDTGDSIYSVDGVPVSTPAQLNDALAAASADGSADLMVFDVNDPGQPAVPWTLPLNTTVTPQRVKARR